MINVPAELQGAYIPKNILQPVVENAIYHGIAPMEEPGTVEILVEREDEMLRICIADSGMGMDEETLSAAKQSIGDTSGGVHSIGMKSIRERFSVYQVAGQRAGNDDDFGEATTSALRARTEDAFIARYRPMYIRQTGQATGAGCIARADFEARQRAARTDETTYVVQGWRQGNGTLWQPNQRVIVFDPVCGFDNTELLVSEVTFTQDQNGTLTEIRVGPPDAYLPEPEAPGARKKKKARVQEDPF